MVVESHGKPMKKALVRSIVQALRDDMNFDQDEVRLEPHLRGSILEIRIRPLGGRSQPSGKDAPRPRTRRVPKPKKRGPRADG
jgi:hypothetical protein